MGIKTRAATLDDIPVMLAMGRAGFAESPRYSSFDYAEAKVERAARASIAAGGARVAEIDGKIVGVIAGFVVEHWFSFELIATDFVFYVDPARRGGRAASLLVDAFEAWAREAGARDVLPGASSQLASDNTASFYRKKGYEQSGYQFFKRLRA